MTGIEGKIIAITGASSGIGEAAAELLAERGAKLVLGARRTDRLEALAGRLDGGATVIATDVRRAADVQALVDLAVERHGRLDVLINNAGVGRVAPLDDLAVGDWEEMVDVNLKGVLHGIAAALPVFRRQAGGHMIATLSTAGLKITPGMAVYAGTKNAARAIFEGLRQEAGADLRVTTISPGFVATPFADGTANPEARATLIEARERMAIPPAAIARAMAFAIEQPADVDVGEIVVRPTAQA